MSPKRPEPIDVLVGQNIRLRRMTKRLSQTELGEKIGVTFQQVQKYEKGVNRVGAGRLSRIAEVLGMPVSSFFDGSEHTKGERNSDASPLSLLAERDAFKLLRAYSMIKNERLRRAIVGFVQHVTADPISTERGAKKRQLL